VTPHTKIYLEMSPRKKRILVVDDEPDIGVTLKIVLEKYEFAVDTFSDPAIALKNFKPDLYDLLIIDIKMAQISGFELYTKMKSIDTKVKVLFLTALRELDEYDNFREKVSPKLGERHFTQKPISNIKLLDQVYSILN
jgi:two-component system, OmpR family, response regulator ChvI